MDKFALVVGASGGVGRALALRLALDGYKVAALGRKKPALESLAEEIEDAGGASPLLIEADLQDLGKIAALAGALAQQYSALDLLVFAKGADVDLMRVIDLTPRHFAENMNSSLIACQMLLSALEGLLARSELSKVVFLTCTDDISKPFNGLRSVIHRAREALAAAYAAECSHQKRVVGVFNPGKIGTPYRLRAFPSEPEATKAQLEALAARFSDWLDKLSHHEQGSNNEAPNKSQNKTRAKTPRG